VTDDEMVKVAQEHGGQYLISLSDWLDKDSEKRQACERLVNARRARWLGVSRGDGGEPGPGIRLLGDDLRNATEST
jgi:hypothetical protein